MVDYVYQDDSNGFPIREQEETTRASLYHVAEHCPVRSHNLTLNEAVDLAQNCPLCRLMSTYGAMHSYWCMHGKKEEEDSQFPSNQSVFH